MRLEFYVVITKLGQNPSNFHVKGLREAREALEHLKVELSRTFGGLTVIPNCTGYFMDNGMLDYDRVEIWSILSATVISHTSAVEYAQKLKQITQQKVQLIVIGDTPYFV